MERIKFIDSIRELLRDMSAAQKDAWILTKAKLLSESEQQDFILSLKGEKIITYMPAEEDIEAFCQKVQNGDIYVEYETHYREFDSFGRYMDDWEAMYLDPQDAFSFLNRTFQGCHDLIILGEYDLAGSILDKVCRLEFQVEESEDSEDFQGDSTFTIAAAEGEQLLSMKAREIGRDWIQALLLGSGNDESPEFAAKLMDIFSFDLCKQLRISDFHVSISETLLGFLECQLEQEKEQFSAELAKFSDTRRYWREQYTLKSDMARAAHLLLDIRKKCRQQSGRPEELEKTSDLKASWKQIDELLQTLSYYEGYTDDQLEVEEVRRICEALIKKGRLGDEDWSMRKAILKDMVYHHYYKSCNCYEPLKQLSEQIYTTDDEILEFADMLNEGGYYTREAAELYRQHGRMERYIDYLKSHLGKSSRDYLELIEYYCGEGKEEEARKIAERGLKACKDDLTGLFIFLLRDAQSRKDEEAFKKLYASAKRRKHVNTAQVIAAIK